MRSPSINIQPQNTIGLLRLALVLIGILAGSYVSIGAAVAEIYKNANPSLAASAWPKNGFALNAVADEKLNKAAESAAKLGKSDIIQGNTAQLQSIGNIALQSFRLEPLNASALRTLAFASEAKGDLKRAKTRMVDAIKFSRRDTTANNWQLQQALKAQNLPVSMQLVDRILREDDSLYINYLPALIAGVSQPGGMNAILPLLLRQPRWEHQFWSMAAYQPIIPSELSALRQKLLIQRRQKIPMVPFLDTDINLMNGLIRSNQFDAAKSLHDFLTGQNDLTAKSKLRGRFNQFGSPFDWQLESKDEVQTYFNKSDNGLNLEVGSNSVGVFARNMVKSTTGRFNVKISTKVKHGLELFARFKCLEINSRVPIVNLALNDNYLSSKIANPVDCNWFSLEILAQNKSDETKSVYITDIELSSN